MDFKKMDAEKEMIKIILGKWISKPVHTAVSLGIPDILSEGSRDIEDLALMTETRKDPLYRMMRALAG